MLDLRSGNEVWFGTSSNLMSTFLASILNDPPPVQRRKPSLSRQQPLLKDDGSLAKIATISYLSACITKWIQIDVENMRHSNSLILKAIEIQRVFHSSTHIKCTDR